MARLTYDEFIDTITNFVWNNLNKEITGPVLRQFIVNILHSTTEMKLKDERTIEKAISDIESAINKLKNNVSVGDGDEGGSSVQFSEQFKNVDDVIWMNLSLITADYEEEEGDDGDSGGSSPPPEENDLSLYEDEGSQGGFSYRAPSAVLGEDVILGWNEDAGSYVLEFVNDVQLNDESRLLSVFLLNLDQLGYYDLEHESGNTLEYEARIRGNEAFLNSIVDPVNEGWYYAMFRTDPYNSNAPDESTPFSDMTPDTWYRILQRDPWYHSLYDYIVLSLFTKEIAFQAGSKLEIKDIVLKRKYT